MRHELKIEQQYFIHINEGKKTFEIRKNDRDFQVGDTISFLPLENESYSYPEQLRQEKIKPCFVWIITYVHQGFGVNQSYCVLGIKPLENDIVNVV